MDTTTKHEIRTAVVTGGSSGLGLALVRQLVDEGWRVVTDGRDGQRLRSATDGLAGVTAVAGDLTEVGHRRALRHAAGERVDLLVHNAGSLGPSPLPPLAELDPVALRALLEVHVVAPLALTQALLEPLRLARGTVLSVSSDAAVEAYPGWGGYGASKAALDHLSAVLAAEEPGLTVLAVDPGDMRTPMHQAAFPGQDISDRPVPEIAARAVLALLTAAPDGVRHRADDVATTS